MSWFIVVNCRNTEYDIVVKVLSGTDYPVKTVQNMAFVMSSSIAEQNRTWIVDFIFSWSKVLSGDLPAGIHSSAYKVVIVQQEEHAVEARGLDRIFVECENYVHVVVSLVQT